MYDFIFGVEYFFVKLLRLDSSPSTLSARMRAARDAHSRRVSAAGGKLEGVVSDVQERAKASLDDIQANVAAMADHVEGLVACGVLRDEHRVTATALHGHLVRAASAPAPALR